MIKFIFKFVIASAVTKILKVEFTKLFVKLVKSVISNPNTSKEQKKEFQTYLDKFKKHNPHLDI